MGNCMPKPHKRSHVVEPTRMTRGNMNIDEILSKSANCLKQNEPADMVTALKVGETDENNAALESPADVKKAVAFTVDLEDEAPVTAPLDTKKALAFTVGVDGERPKTKPSKLLADKSDKEKGSAGEFIFTVDEESLMDEILREAGDTTQDKDTKVPDVKKNYTSEERSLMAEIMREDRLKEIKEKARQEEVKRFDAKMRRAVAEGYKASKLESLTASCAPVADDQRKKVRDLAAEDRRRAAERRRVEEKKEYGGWDW